MAGLKRGAVVELRSGGPVMTIEKIGMRYGSPDRYAWCQWFDQMRLRDGVFALHSLAVRKPQAGEDGDAGDEEGDGI